MKTSDRSASTRANYAMYKAHGICVVCGHEDAMPGITACVECRALRNEWSAKWRTTHAEENARRKEEEYKRLKNEGRCVSCGKQARPGKTLCEKCARKESIRNRQRYVPVFKPQEQCRWCDKPTVEGRKLCAEHLAKMREVMARAQLAKQQRREMQSDR